MTITSRAEPVTELKGDVVGGRRGAEGGGSLNVEAMVHNHVHPKSQSMNGRYGTDRWPVLDFGGRGALPHYFIWRETIFGGKIAKSFARSVSFARARTAYLQGRARHIIFRARRTYLISRHFCFSCGGNAWPAAVAVTTIANRNSQHENLFLGSRT